MSEESEDESWTLYRKSGMAEMRPYNPGEDLSGVSVQPDHVPAQGDMIARDPDNPGDRWLVAAEFFKKNYERA